MYDAYDDVDGAAAEGVVVADILIAKSSVE